MRCPFSLSFTTSPLGSIERATIYRWGTARMAKG